MLNYTYTLPLDWKLSSQISHDSTPSALSISKSLDCNTSAYVRRKYVVSEIAYSVHSSDYYL